MTELEKKAAEEVEATEKTAAFNMGVSIALKNMNLTPDQVIKAAAAKDALFKDATAENLHERIIDWVDQSLQQQPAPTAKA